MLNNHRSIKKAIERNIEHNLVSYNNSKIYKYIFKYNFKTKDNYIVDTPKYYLTKLTKSNMNYSQLIYNNKPIRFIFKSNTIDYLTKLCDKIYFNKYQLVIYKDKDKYYIINPNIYFNNKEELDNLLIELKEDYNDIELIEDIYIPYIFNKNVDIICPINMKIIVCRIKSVREKIFNNSILNPIDIEGIELYFKDKIVENIDTIRIEGDELNKLLKDNNYIDDENECLIKKENKLYEDKILNKIKKEELKKLKKELNNQKKLEKEQAKLNNKKKKEDKKLKEEEIKELEIIGEDNYYVEDTEVIEDKLPDIIKKETENIIINHNILLNNDYISDEKVKNIDDKLNDITETSNNYLREELIKNEDIILYDNFEDIVKNSDKKYIFKILEFKNKKVVNSFYVYDIIDKIIKLKPLIDLDNKYSIYQYIDYNKPIRLYFYLNSINNLIEICELLDIKLEDIIIHKLNIIKPIINGKPNKFNNEEEDKKYMIIHKIKYFNTKLDLDIYLFNKNIVKYYINIEIKKYIPFIFSKYIKLINYNIGEKDNNLKIMEEYDDNMILKYSIINLNITQEKKSKINLTEYRNKRTIKKKYVDYKDFDKDADIIFIRSSMGSGKSTSLVNYINNTKDIVNKKILIISSRITLSNTIFQKFNNSDIKFSNYLTIPDNDILTNCLKLIISPNSLIRLQEPLQKYDIIWIDEATSLISYLVSFPYYDLRNILDVLFRIVYQTKQLILTDADIDDLLIETYIKMKNTTNYQYLYYNNYIKVNNLTYKLIPEIYNNICDDIKNEKNLYICSDSIRETKRIYKFIIDEAKLKEEDILLYNSESIAEYDKFILKGVNNFWNKYKIVIVSPKVIYGIDFTERHFHRVYGIYRGGSILSCREISQQLNRIRNILDKEITINLVRSNSNLVSDIYTFSYYLEKKYYNRVFLNRLSLGGLNNRTELDNILNMLKFIYNEDNYRILDRNDPYNLMVMYKNIERNKGLNTFEI